METACQRRKQDVGQGAMPGSSRTGFSAFPGIGKRDAPVGKIFGKKPATGSMRWHFLHQDALYMYDG
jgi:hypothetical protein